MTDRLGRSSVLRVIHSGRKFDYVEMTYSLRGESLKRTCVRHPGAVVILPILDTPGGARVVMIRNYRFGPDRVLLELPAGGLEPGEDPAHTASRELIEEAGYEAARVEKLCEFFTSPGMSDELMHAYVARGLKEVGQRTEADEEISVIPMAPEAALRMVRTGEVVDGKTILLLLRARDAGMI